MTSTQALVHQPDDPRLVWKGVLSLERTDEWVTPWRLPHPKRGLFPPERLQKRAQMPAGVHIAFQSDTTMVALPDDLHPNAEGYKLMGKNISRAFADILAP
jgi:lysophospholipase L1-like esterase